MTWAKGISEGTHVGATTHQALLGLLARPGVLWAPGAPPLMLFAPEIQKYSEKIVSNFQNILRTFIFGSFFIARRK